MKKIKILKIYIFLFSILFSKNQFSFQYIIPNFFTKPFKKIKELDCLKNKVKNKIQENKDIILSVILFGIFYKILKKKLLKTINHSKIILF